MILIRIQIKINQTPSILQSYAAFLNDFVMPLIPILTFYPSETEVLVLLHISIYCSQQQKQAFILINPGRSSLYSSLCRQPPLTSICLWALLWQRSLARSMDGWMDGWTPAFTPSHSSHEETETSPLAPEHHWIAHVLLPFNCIHLVDLEVYAIFSWCWTPKAEIQNKGN